MADTAVIVNGWERALMAGEKVRERLRRATRALDDAAVPYAVVGGNAVAEWVGRIDEEAVRNTRDIDLLIRRADFPAARTALETAGFVHRQVPDVETFIDGPEGRPSAGVHIIFAGEKVRSSDEQTAPAVEDSERTAEFRVAKLEALVLMKLSAWRDKDRMHLRDLMSVGLIDATWPIRLPSPLDKRLQELLDNPNG